MHVTLVTILVVVSYGYAIQKSLKMQVMVDDKEKKAINQPVQANASSAITGLSGSTVGATTETRFGSALPVKKTRENNVPVTTSRPIAAAHAPKEANLPSAESTKKNVLSERAGQRVSTVPEVFGKPKNYPPHCNQCGGHHEGSCAKDGDPRKVAACPSCFPKLAKPRTVTTPVSNLKQ